MSPIHSLPVELLTRIFLLGTEAQPAPDYRDHSTHNFEVLVSHVCRSWRIIALHTPSLWTTMHFKTKAHLLHRGKEYLERNRRLPFDIYIDTVSQETYNRHPHTLFRDEFLPVFDVVLPDIKRWRELHLKVCDLDCKGRARRVLSTCGQAPLLRTLQLWHVQNWHTTERLFGAIGPPPVIVFDGQLPSLKNILLQGVNLPWTSSPFLVNLSSIEYALHSDDVRMPWDQWRAMLDSSPNLQRISLHYSGPRAKSTGAFPSDGIEWWGADPPGPDEVLPPGYQLPPTAEPVFLPHLKEIQIHDLDCDYLVALFRTMEAPALTSLHLDLDTEDQDFSPLIEYLAAPPQRRHVVPLKLNGKSNGTSNGKGNHSDRDAPESPTSSDDDPSGTGAANGQAYTYAYVQDEASMRPQPKFPKLEQLTVTALLASVQSWRHLLESERALTRLECDFGQLPAGAFEVLFGSVRAELASGAGVDAGKSRDKGKGKGEVNGVHAGDGDTDEAGGEAVADADKVRKAKGKDKANTNTKASATTDADEADEADVEDDGGAQIPILPALEALRVAGVTGKQLAALAAHRRERGARVRLWEVEESGGDAEGEALCAELKEISRRWREERLAEIEAIRRGEREDVGEGAREWVKEPWRLDQPLEKMVWYREEVGWNEEEDGEFEGDEGGEEEEEEEGEGEEYTDEEEAEAEEGA